MREKPYAEHKTALTPAEKLRVAVAVLVDGFDQHRIAALMGVNPGRVAEAVVAVRKAIEPEAEPVQINHLPEARLVEQGEIEYGPR